MADTLMLSKYKPGYREQFTVKPVDVAVRSFGHAAVRGRRGETAGARPDGPAVGEPLEVWEAWSKELAAMEQLDAAVKRGSLHG